MTRFRRIPSFCFLSIFCWGAPALFAANTSWQQARIVEVRTVTNDRTTAWVVNTPVVDEEKICEITIHFGTRIVRATYVLGKTQAAPPAEWIKHAPVRAQLVGDTLFLKALTGEQYRLRVESNKPGPATDPWTADELEAEKSANAEEKEQTKSLVGSHEPQSPAKSDPAAASAPATTPATAAPTSQEAAPAESQAPAAADPTTGTVSISSTPYLADLYVDGENMGYTPAKLKLVPGKHTFRCEKQGYKPWTKEITLTTGSELTLDATLERR
jgi:hypothetical protein